MLVGRLIFDNDELGRLRWRAAEFIRYMIRARAKVDPGFMSPADYELWELDGLKHEDWALERLLQRALQTILEINEKYLDRCGSGGMRLDVADPLQQLKELIGFFTDYQVALPAAICGAIAGNPIKWSELAHWEELSAIRTELDKLPRLDDQLQTVPDGPDQQRNEIRWDGRSEAVGPKILKFAAYLWNTQSVSKQELLDLFWRDRTGDGVLSASLTRLNQALSALRVPWTYHLQGDYVVKDSYTS